MFKQVFKRVVVIGLIFLIMGVASAGARFEYPSEQQVYYEAEQYHHYQMRSQLT